MKKLVVFDFDNVIIRGQSQQYLLSYLVEKQKIKLWQSLRIYFWFFLKKIGFLIKPDNIRKFAYSVFQGWSVDEFDQFLGEFHEKIVRKKYIRQACDLLRIHINSGDDVLIVSATLKNIVQNCLGDIGEVNFIATELEIHEGKHTGKIKGEVAYGETKLKVIKQYIENKKDCQGVVIAAYTDDFSDRFLLDFSKIPIVINPDSKLREYALLKQWKIHDF